ncbi:exosortase-associated protein EpsI, B-type [Pseudoduganella chitinolytica]|uniref:EpsI family protein n=1 Tax=Pseudoduganella chitinolytica TaxID=34070 RepID=A0ABY8BK10_9BURK|nr:exosortase-associated protein EpsI, B-type [Pseudoduganella chitinolytica]WEF35678.1 EpsI family protein [Pseudoduganella chitinolytica]
MKNKTLGTVLFALMASTAAITYAVAPTAKMADKRAKFDLDTGVPRNFGDWKVDPMVVPLQVDPDTQTRLNRIYNQTLSRTYMNSRGERVMLSIAYGGDQSDNMGVHKPEVCYAAQGFGIRDVKSAEVATDQGALPVRQLLAVAGARSEPITYWITIGDTITRPGFDQRLQELKIGLTGQVPDGMLVRVSSIDTDASRAYALQGEFIRALVGNLPAPDRARLIGASANLAPNS